VRAILDDARTTGLHPPGDALSADDWAQLTQELEEDYSVGSFEAEVEANPLPAGQQYVLDVFDRIDGIVGAGRGTLSLGEMVKAVGLDEGLRLALGMGAELLGGEEQLAEVHGIFGGVEESAPRSGGQVSVKELGEHLRARFARSTPRTRSLGLVPEADPAHQTITNHLQSFDSPLSAERMLSPGRAHTKATIVVPAAQGGAAAAPGDPPGLQLGVVGGSIAILSVSHAALLECPLLERGMVLLSTNLNDVVSVGVRAGESLVELREAKGSRKLTLTF